MIDSKKDRVFPGGIKAVPYEDRVSVVITPYHGDCRLNPRIQMHVRSLSGDFKQHRLDRKTRAGLYVDRLSNSITELSELARMAGIEDIKDIFV